MMDTLIDSKYILVELVVVVVMNFIVFVTNYLSTLYHQ